MKLLLHVPAYSFTSRPILVKRSGVFFYILTDIEAQKRGVMLKLSSIPELNSFNDTHSAEKNSV
jgi:hypothetical protein